MNGDDYRLHEKEIDECLGNFEFSKVQSCMDKMNWKWYNSKTESTIPSVYELIKEAKRLFSSCQKQLQQNGKEAYAACGGLEASIVKDKDEYFYTLKFVVEDSIYPIV